jgi:hypothetical protein
VIETLLHQTKQAGLEVGGRDWLAAVLGAIAADRSEPLPPPSGAREARLRLQGWLRQSGLGYGFAAADPAVDLPANAGPGLSAFAFFVAGLGRASAHMAAQCGARWFSGEEAALADEGPRARQVQLTALLGALVGEAKAAAPLFAEPEAATDAKLLRLLEKASSALGRRFRFEGLPFAGLPLQLGLCAIEGHELAMLSLASFARGRISHAGAALARLSALRWRALLTELFAGLARAGEGGEPAERAYEQLILGQRLPAREARLLRASLSEPREPEELARVLLQPAQRRFVLEQMLLAAQLDGRFPSGGVAFVERLAAAVGASAEELANIDAEVETFHAKNAPTWNLLRGAEVPEGLPRALTSRIQAAVVDNLDRIVQEIRETGELAELLARAASGTTLSAAEKAKVREQLIDLAKTIPALAIFAAPGGALLLAVLIKLLPFNLLPSSFSDERPRYAAPAARARPPAS